MLFYKGASKVLNVLDSRVGDILKFYYASESSEARWRIVRVNEIGSYYINAQDLEKDVPRNFNIGRISLAEWVGGPDAKVLTMAEVAAEVLKNPEHVTAASDSSYLYEDAGLALEQLYGLNPEVAGIKFLEGFGMFVVETKSKPKMELNVNPSGYVWSFTNERGEELLLSYDEKDGLEIRELSQASVRNSKKAPSAREFAGALNEHFA
jgi:hypothetical protein